MEGEDEKKEEGAAEGEKSAESTDAEEAKTEAAVEGSAEGEKAEGEAAA